MSARRRERGVVGLTNRSVDVVPALPSMRHTVSAAPAPRTPTAAAAAVAPRTPTAAAAAVAPRKPTAAAAAAAGGDYDAPGPAAVPAQQEPPSISKSQDMSIFRRIALEEDPRELFRLSRRRRARHDIKVVGVHVAPTRIPELCPRGAASCLTRICAIKAGLLMQAQERYIMFATDLMHRARCRFKDASSMYSRVNRAEDGASGVRWVAAACECA